MKKLRRAIAALTLTSTLIFGAGGMVQVRADDQTSGGPQGTSASKSGGPSSTSGTTMTDAEWAYFLWLLMMWLIWGGL